MKRERRRGYAVTHPEARDPSLRGRTYGVPFEQVWRAALELTNGKLRGWHVSEHDDEEGVIVGTAKSLTGALHDFMVRIYLDADAQTRVDASAQAHKPLADFGRARRRVRRFFRSLDKRLAQKPERTPARR